MSHSIRKSWLPAAAASLVAVAALVAAGCGGSDGEASAALEQDAKYWQQLTSLMQPSSSRR